MSIQGLKLALAPWAWRLLRASLRVDRFDARLVGGPGPFIFACLHRDILPAIIFVEPARPSLLVSSSADGDILVRTLGTRKYGFVRGATGEDGGRALVALRRELNNGHSIGLAVDGPQGPFGTIHPGVVKLAGLSGAPILPLLARAARATHLGTWDRTLVPWPGSRVRIEMGSPLQVAPDSGPGGLQGMTAALAGFFRGREGGSA